MPDVPNFSWAEYGLRCGLPRMIDAIAGRGLPASASLNASVIDAYPAAADALLRAGWEFIGHGIHQRALSQDGGAGQAEAIAAALDRIERFSGARPRGWLSPGLRETSETPDLLAQAGVDYVFDWCLDDLPNWMRAAPRPLLALPYALELNDSVIHAVEKHATGEFGRRLEHTLNVYAREAAASGMPRVLTLGLHPHLMGVPHRYPDFEAMLDRLQRHSMTRFVTGAELYAWYAGQCSPPRARREIRHERRANHRRARRGAVPASRQRHRHAGRAPAAPALRGPAGRSRRRRPDLSAGRHRRRAVGSRHPRMPTLKRAAAALGQGAEATVWASGERLPLASAVMLNAYQVFNQEFDAIHDRAVVHAFACIAPAALGYAEREGGVDGRRLITAVAAGLDFAIHVALAQRAPMRFFRPAMCGGLGATATLCKLAGLDEAATRDALGLAYSHLSGTMQAHIEGSPAVGLQVGLNARAAVTAFELARAGFPGPRDILEGPFGYFALYDTGQARWDEVAGDVGRVFQIARMSHKPYPTGRATHSGIGAALRLMREHALLPEDIAGMKVHASSLIVRLVGRPPGPAWTRPPPGCAWAMPWPRPSCMAGWASRISIRTRWPIRAGWNWPPASRCWTTAIRSQRHVPAARGTASAGRPLPDAGHARVSGQPGAAAGRSRAGRQVPRLLRLGPTSRAAGPGRGADPPPAPPGGCGRAARDRRAAVDRRLAMPRGAAMAPR